MCSQRLDRRQDRLPTSFRGLVKRKLNEGFAAGPVISIPKSQGAPMPFDDLAA